MTELMKAMVACDRKYNHGDPMAEVFGFDRRKHYDLLVVAPGWKPTKLLPPEFGTVTVTAVHSYMSGYEVEFGTRRMAWMQTSSSGSSLIDTVSLCAELDFDKLVFVGAVGGLKPGFQVGDVCTPTHCVEGTMAPAYLMEDPRSFRPFGTVVPADQGFIDGVLALAEVPVRRASVFCTDSIFGEYYHLDFIKSFGTDLIEMETSTFYRMAAMLEKPAIALLVVSDNSANGEPLLGRSEDQSRRYNAGRNVQIPKLLKQICEMVL